MLEVSTAGRILRDWSFFYPLPGFDPNFFGVSGTPMRVCGYIYIYIFTFVYRFGMFLHPVTVESESQYGIS